MVDVIVSDLQDLIDESHEDLERDMLPRFLLLAGEPPWFLTVDAIVVSMRSTGSPPAAKPFA
ncbi:hypothetical protein Mro03_28480 [Microbispora rosea subsp. rosea]|nr:hypothetical protein Mro03_28480 [Microbispora rosea subsp. rosea]